MPTILLLKGFRFFFFSNENNESAHVHVVKEDAYGKVWIEPIMRIAYLTGFNKNEISDIEEIIKNHLDLFKLKWNEYFSK